MSGLIFTSLTPVKDGDAYVLAGGTLGCDIAPGDMFAAVTSSNDSFTDALFRIEGDPLVVQMGVIVSGVYTKLAEDSFVPGDYLYRVSNDQIAGRTIVLDAAGRRLAVGI